MKAGFHNSGFGVNDLMKYTWKKKEKSHLLGSLSHPSLQDFFFFLSSTTARNRKLKAGSMGSCDYQHRGPKHSPVLL